jgi:hypothetical protein
VLGYGSGAGVVYKRVPCERCGKVYYYRLARHVRALTLVPFIMICLAFFISPAIGCCSAPIIPIPMLGGYLLIIRSGRSPMQMPIGSSLTEGEEETAAATNRKLRDALKDGVEPVACPDCGWFQKNMITEIRAREHAWMAWLAMWWLVMSIPVSAVAVASGNFGDETTVWMIGVGTGLVLMILTLSVRHLLALRVNPNQPGTKPWSPDADTPPAIREQERLAQLAGKAKSIPRPKF